ncbi:ABC transporter substrate-binding protein [Bradyrhizobium sp. AUGA SZCCT0240]|uniref:ABC transporter substrate-binding protein n=1 Tax=Bradyrhizobium sp. AUGA SZCCT0240 TaxID=2807669 RepID=UPI001BADEE83|nr:ABC transporter substrate-binding protein [Bradyrhizobium sp. AUGA SZCCT0240]MBR1252283.1 ABC transporter substrate-binding protein [Bradyrhizobium sp. AUGA SZCCT0240]
MGKNFRRGTVLAAIAVTGVTLLTSSAVSAQNQYDTGATDTEIKIGQTMPYSGPASAYALIGRVMSGYFTMVNEVQGGINGRRVNLISYDDAFSPPKTVEQTRKLVESDEVLAVTASLGSPTNLAVAKYLNAKKTPQILAMAGAAKLDDPANLPWTTTFYSSANVETQIYAEYILRERPHGKIAVLYQNDDFGKNYLTGLKAALGDKASMIIREESYNLTDPTVDSQVIALKASGADVLLIAAGPKFTAQVIRKNYELGWRPMQIVVTASSQIQTVLRPAGIEASKGLVTSQWIKEVGDPTWDDDPAMLAFRAFMAKWVSGAQPEDGSTAYAYSTAQMLHEILRRCGDDLRRENLIKQATNIKDFQLPLFVPGVTVNVSPTSRIGWRKARLVKFDGTKWTSFGDIVTIPESATKG